MEQLPGRNARAESKAMKAYIKALQMDVYGQRSSQRDPESEYLLGFEKEKVDPLPIKTYIRRLWLAFESGRGTLPRRFLDPRVERFVQGEINTVVNELVNDPLKLAAELNKDHVEVVDTEDRRRGFLEDIVDHILVTRDWGDELWGHRKECRSEPANSRPEPGHTEAPVWPRNKCRISLAVRQWIAAQVQERVRDPRHWKDKKVPAISCPENPQERWKALRATFGTRERESSPDKVFGDRGAGPAIYGQDQGNGSSSSPLERCEPVSAITAQSATLCPDDSMSTSQSRARRSTQETFSSCSQVSSDSTVTSRGTKRKRSEQTLSQKRSKATKIHAARSQNENTFCRVRVRRSSSNLASGAALRAEESNDNQDRVTRAPASELVKQQDKHALHASWREPITPSGSVGKRAVQVNAVEMTAINLPPTPTSRDSASRHVLVNERSSLANQSLGANATPPRSNTYRRETRSTISQNAIATQHGVPTTKLRSASRSQVFGPTTLLAGSPSPVANPCSPVVRSTSPPTDPTIYKATVQEALPDHEGEAEQTDIEGQTAQSLEKSQILDTNTRLAEAKLWRGEHSEGNPSEKFPEDYPNGGTSINATECDIQASLQFANQPRSILGAYPARQATDAFLEEAANGLSDRLSTPSTALAADSSIMLPTQSNGITMKGLELHSVQAQELSNVSRDSFRESNASLDKAAGGSQRANALPATDTSTSLPGISLKGDYAARVASLSKTVDLIDLPFPEGASSIPPKCRQCVHSLSKAVDVMPDKGGFAQWKLRCYHCRFPQQARRPSPCMCHRCCQSASEQGSVTNQWPNERQESSVGGESAVGQVTSDRSGLAASSTKKPNGPRIPFPSSGVDEPTANPRLACSQCKYGDGGIEDLALHVFTTHTGDARVVCLDCNFEDEMQGDRFAEHMGIVHHLGSRLFPCPAADYETKHPRWRDLQLHYLEIRKGPYICGLRASSHESETALKRHQESRMEKETRSELRERQRLKGRSVKRAKAIAAAQLSDSSNGQPYTLPPDVLSTASGAGTSQLLPVGNATMSNGQRSTGLQVHQEGQNQAAEPCKDQTWLDQLCSASFDAFVDLTGLDESTPIDLTGSEEQTQA